LGITVIAETLEENLARIRDGIDRACARVARETRTVRLVAVSKTVSREDAAMAAAAGIRDFGENYVRELREKRPAAPDATWHFVGTLQTNTARHVAELADFVHGIGPGKAVERLARRAEASGKTLPVLLQVDFTGERAGIAPEHVGALADDVGSLKGVALAGLMTLPPMPERPEDARPYFRRLRELGEEVRRTHPGAVELSMGMSLDYEVAVEEGATMVRIGTALFGERPLG